MITTLVHFLLIAICAQCAEVVKRQVFSYSALDPGFPLLIGGVPQGTGAPGQIAGSCLMRVPQLSSIRQRRQANQIKEMNMIPFDIRVNKYNRPTPLHPTTNSAPQQGPIKQSISHRLLPQAAYINRSIQQTAVINQPIQTQPRISRPLPPPQPINKPIQSQHQINRPVQLSLSINRPVPLLPTFNYHYPTIPPPQPTNRPLPPPQPINQPIQPPPAVHQPIQPPATLNYPVPQPARVNRPVPAPPLINAPAHRPIPLPPPPTTTPPPAYQYNDWWLWQYLAQEHGFELPTTTVHPNYEPTDPPEFPPGPPGGRPTTPPPMYHYNDWFLLQYLAQEHGITMPPTTPVEPTDPPEFPVTTINPLLGGYGAGGFVDYYQYPFGKKRKKRAVVASLPPSCICIPDGEIGAKFIVQTEYTCEGTGLSCACAVIK